MFLVINAPSSYNIIFRRDPLNSLCVVISTLQLTLKPDQEIVRMRFRDSINLKA